MHLRTATLLSGLVLGACQADPADQPAAPEQSAVPEQSTVPAEAAAPPFQERVLQGYVAIAQASYEDSLLAARELQGAIQAFLAAPDEAGLETARQAWRDSRVPYMQTEVFRFGNAVVDEWEPRVNAWPLDEGLIDYVAASYGEESDENYFYSANIIANPQLEIGGIAVDATEITPELLSTTLHMIDGVESNVATGYHAIEFLLWGQDLNGTEPGAGMRPWTDFSLEECSNGNCDRRRAYLEAATTLLLSDLDEMLQSWAEGGAAYEDLMSKGPNGGLAAVFTGMGSLSYGELAGERTRLALLLHDPEEEHDCFSDNTHFSHYYDAVGINNIWYGRYQRSDGSQVTGASLDELARSQDPAAAERMAASLAETELAMQALVDAAEAGSPFDVLIAPDNSEGEVLVQRVVDALVAQTRSLENVIATLDLNNVGIEGSDSLDAP